MKKWVTTAISKDGNDEYLRNMMETDSSTRRKMVQASLLFLSSTCRPALASTDPTDPTNFFTFQDEDCGFEVKIPVSWEKSVQTLADRRKIILFIEPNTMEEEDKTLLFLAYTPVRDDFTSLSSFGTVDQVLDCYCIFFIAFLSSFNQIHCNKR